MIFFANVTIFYYIHLLSDRSYIFKICTKSIQLIIITDCPLILRKNELIWVVVRLQTKIIVVLNLGFTTKLRKGYSK